MVEHAVAPMLRVYVCACLGHFLVPASSSREHFKDLVELHRKHLVELNFKHLVEQHKMLSL